MKKLLLIGLIGAVAVVAVAKKTNLCSYTSTLIAQVSREAKEQVPTKFELARIREEIANMDTDINQMIRPIAEYKVAVARLRHDITKSQASIAEQKQTLLTALNDLSKNPEKLTYNGQSYTSTQVRQQVERDTVSLKKLEKYVKTQQQILEAKEASLVATQEQLAKLVAKKRDYELRLAQLEADEERLQTERIGSDLKVDSGRATQIDAALADLEHRQKVLFEEIQMRNHKVVNVPLDQRNQPAATDLQAIRNYLEGREQSADNDQKTASNNR
jgi:chromosome segregation ATPase